MEGSAGRGCGAFGLEVMMGATTLNVDPARRAARTWSGMPEAAVKEEPADNEACRTRFSVPEAETEEPATSVAEAAWSTYRLTAR